MTVTLKLIGHFIHSAGFSERQVEVPEGTTVAGLLEAVGLQRAGAGIIVRGGQAVRLDERLSPGDRIVVSPIYSGG